MHMRGIISKKGDQRCDIQHADQMLNRTMAPVVFVTTTEVHSVDRRYHCAVDDTSLHTTRPTACTMITARPPPQSRVCALPRRVARCCRCHHRKAEAGKPHPVPGENDGRLRQALTRPDIGPRPGITQLGIHPRSGVRPHNPRVPTVSVSCSYSSYTSPLPPHKHTQWPPPSHPSSTSRTRSLPGSRASASG